jgi:signal transduction histidine kinase
MRARLSIRTRFALMSALLAVGVLAAGMFTVYLIQRRTVEQNLRQDARNAAVALAAAGDRDVHGGSSGGDDSGEDGSGAQRPSEPSEDGLRTYLQARGGTNQLLVSIAKDGTVLSNASRAAPLGAMDLPAAGGEATVTLDGERYQVAVARGGGGRAVAALPVAEAEAAVHRLVMAMLIVCAIGLIPATVAAWFAARRALAPLSQIAHRATRVTGGDLSMRVGPVATHDEIAEVAVALDAMLDRLESAFEAQRRFVHDASHELRTPLTIARGHLEVALPAESDPAVREAVQVAIGELDRMGRLVDSLLRLARDGNDEALREQVDLGELAAAVVERSRVLGERNWRVDAEPGVVVDGDGDALEQVLLNLVVNAVRHTTPGDPVTVTVGQEAGSARLEVADGGEGIDPELLPRLFDRFVRADSARGRDTGGAGLGLAICRSIVEEHGGRIRAENAESGGARFVIELPVTDQRQMRRVSSLSHA